MESLLGSFVPQWDVWERHQVLVRAPADVTFATAERFDFHSVGPISAIFRLRAWFMRATPPPRRWDRGFLDEARTIGWGELQREPGRFIVMGAVVRPWLGDVVFRAVPAAQFREFAEPGLVKIAWTLEAVSQADGRTCLRTETRAVATDADARRRFKAYWRWARFGIVAIRLLVLPAIRREAERTARGRGYARDTQPSSR